jgi:hypothetical protein
MNVVMGGFDIRKPRKLAAYQRRFYDATTVGTMMAGIAGALRSPRPRRAQSEDFAAFVAYAAGPAIRGSSLTFASVLSWITSIDRKLIEKNQPPPKRVQPCIVNRHKADEVS